MPARAVAKVRADVADLLRLDTADRRHALGREFGEMRPLRLPILGERRDVLLVAQPLLGDHVHDRVEQRDVGPGAELQHAVREAPQADSARIHHDQLAAALGELLEVGRGHRMVLDRIGADHDRHVGVQDLVEGRRHRARADVLHQRGDRGGVAQPRAVVDVVVAESLPDQLLEQIGLLVGALGAAEARHRLPAALVAQPPQPLGGRVQRLLPGRLAEDVAPVLRIDVQPLGRRVVAAQQRLGEPVRMMDVVEAEPALHAQPPLIGRSVEAVDMGDFAVPDLEADLAADAAERADARHLRLRARRIAGLLGVHHRGRHQRAGRAGLHALAAGHAGALAHRVGEIEDRIGIMAAPAHPDHVVDLDLAARPHAQPALDAGVEIDAHGDVAAVEGRNPPALQRRKAAL